MIMQDGKKRTAEKIIYAALSIILKKIKKNHSMTGKSTSKCWSNCRSKIKKSWRI
jgi:hypothetical protein